MVGPIFQKVKYCFISKKENVYNYEEKEILTNKDYFIENILSKSLFEKEKIISAKLN